MESPSAQTAAGGRARLPRVGIVAASLEIVGGQSIAAVLLAAALREDGHEVTMVPVNPTLPRPLRWVRRFRAARTVVNQVFYWPLLLRLSRCDVVHVFSAAYWSFLLAPVPAMLAGRLLRKQVVLHYHSGEAADHLTWGWAVHPWLSLAHEIVVPSAFVARAFSAHGHDVKVIANFIQPSAFCFRDRHDLRPRLVSTRNFEPHYGVSTVLRAFELIKARYADATLTIVGSGSEEKRLRELAATLGVAGVDFRGQVSPAEMPAVLGAADVFLNASIVDNQPLSILEAFASGLPVVSTPVGGIPEMVRDGQTGILVRVGDPAAMADAVCALLDHPDRAVAISREARREVENYVWPVVRPAWAGVYGRVGAPARVAASASPDEGHG